MRYQTIIAAFAALAGVASAFPQAGNDAATGASLFRRGHDPDPECKDCPPDPCFNCTTGCISIVCQKCEGGEDKEDCCKCLGLDHERHVYLSQLFELTFSSSITQTRILGTSVRTSKSIQVLMQLVMSSTIALNFIASSLIPRPRYQLGFWEPSLDNGS